MTDEPRGMNHGEENPGELNARIPAAGADRHVRSGSGVDRACGADRQRNEEQANQYPQTREEAERDWDEINRILPGTSLDAEHQPGERSDRGARVRWNELLRSGVPSRQIVRHAESYVARQRKNDQWVAGVGGFLAHHFDPKMQEDGTYPDDPANDNLEPAPEPQIIRCGT